MTSLYQAALDALLAGATKEKITLTKKLEEDWANEALSLATTPNLPNIKEAGRPEKPLLVAPRELPRRRLGSPEGIAALIHAVAHIEFNAINLACDAVYRFQGMPKEYYNDWINVAAEEAYHFSLIEERLNELGYHYGDFPAHNGLWDLAVNTRHDLRLRMALVPRLMEARGLDVTPGMIERFAKNNEHRTVEILKIILADEVGHVEAGSRWFNYLCQQQGDDPETTYFQLLEQHFPAGVSCPLNHEARLNAGFSQHELDTLEDLCAQKRQKR